MPFLTDVNGEEVTTSETLNMIDSADIAVVWPLARPHLLRAMNRAPEVVMVSTLYNDLLEKRNQLWTYTVDGNICGAMVTKITRDPHGVKICKILLLAGGSITFWKGIWKGLENAARAQGCNRLEGLARKGWERHLPEYKRKMVYLSKEL